MVKLAPTVCHSFQNIDTDSSIKVYIMSGYNQWWLKDEKVRQPRLSKYSGSDFNGCADVDCSVCYKDQTVYATHSCTACCVSEDADPSSEDAGFTDDEDDEDAYEDNPSIPLIYGIAPVAGSSRGKRIDFHTRKLFLNV